MNQPPFDRKDLSVPPLDGPEFIQLLHDQRNEMYPQPPAFYEALIEGRLSREVLALWVKNQYYYWGYGLTFSTGAIVCKTNEPALRRLMIRKSVRVEGKNVVNDLNPEWVGPSYEELWLQFGEGLGIDRDEVTSFHPYTRSYFAVSTLCLLARWWEWSWLDGIASFYAADLLGRDYMPQVHDALRRALRRFQRPPALLPDLPRRRYGVGPLGGGGARGVGVHDRAATHRGKGVPQSTGHRAPAVAAPPSRRDRRTGPAPSALGPARPR